MPNGCSLLDSADAARDRSSLFEVFSSKEITSLTSKQPNVSVPVLSNAIVSTLPIFSRASPDLIMTPRFVACPIAAIIAVGVASTKAHGQNTTRTVTARIISFVTKPEIMAIIRATGTR